MAPPHTRRTLSRDLRDRALDVLDRWLAALAAGRHRSSSRALAALARRRQWIRRGIVAAGAALSLLLGMIVGGAFTGVRVALPPSTGAGSSPWSVEPGTTSGRQSEGQQPRTAAAGAGRQRAASSSAIPTTSPRALPASTTTAPTGGSSPSTNQPPVAPPSTPPTSATPTSSPPTTSQPKPSPHPPTTSPAPTTTTTDPLSQLGQLLFGSS